MNPSDLKRTGHWPRKEIAFCIAADDDGNRCWTGSSDAAVAEWNITIEKPQRQLFEGDGHTSYVTGIVRHNDRLISSGYDRRLVLWDLPNRKMLSSIEAHDKWIRRMILSPDGSRIITVADDMRCRVWDRENGQQIADFSDHELQTPHHYPSMLYAVAISPDGTQIATGDRIGHVAIWDATTFRKIGQLETPTMYTWDPQRRRHSIGGIRSLAFSPDGKRLAVGGMGQVGNIDHLQGKSRIEVFDWESGERLQELEDDKRKGLVEAIVWHPDAKWFLAAGGDHKGFITIYESESGEMLHQAEHNGHIHSLCHDKAFRRLFVASHDGISRWEFQPTA